MAKKILALVLGATLCLSINCVTASAAEVNNNSNVTAAGNVTNSGKIRLAKVTTNGVRIRVRPNGTILGQAYKGDVFIVEGYTNGWYKIQYNHGTAYISAQYVTTFLTTAPYGAELVK